MDLHLTLQELARKVVSVKSKRYCPTNLPFHFATAAHNLHPEIRLKNQELDSRNNHKLLTKLKNSTN